MTALDYAAMDIGIIMLLLTLGLPPILIARVAERRGRDLDLWRCITLIIPLLSLLYLLSVPPIDDWDELNEGDLPGLP